MRCRCRDKHALLEILPQILAQTTGEEVWFLNFSVHEATMITNYNITTWGRFRFSHTRQSFSLSVIMKRKGCFDEDELRKKREEKSAM